MLLLIQESAANDCFAANWEIAAKLRRCRFRNWQPETTLLPIQKSAAKLCRCRFRNQQPETASLLIQKSAARHCVAADSEIGSDGGVISVPLLVLVLLSTRVYTRVSNNNFTQLVLSFIRSSCDFIAQHHHKREYHIIYS
jgi:hypothetical protein